MSYHSCCLIRSENIETIVTVTEKKKEKSIELCCLFSDYTSDKIKTTQVHLLDISKQRTKA